MSRKCSVDRVLRTERQRLLHGHTEEGNMPTCDAPPCKHSSKLVLAYPFGCESCGMPSGGNGKGRK